MALVARFDAFLATFFAVFLVAFFLAPLCFVPALDATDLAPRFPEAPRLAVFLEERLLPATASTSCKSSLPSAEGIRPRRVAY